MKPSRWIDENLNLRDILTEIQCQGIQVPSDIRGRKGGAGPAEGRSFILGGIPVHVPIAASYVSRSPFSLTESGSSWVLLKNGREVTELNVVREPEFYGHSTRDGINLRQIALLHGRDCLATTVLQRCVFWKRSRKCAFCATETSVANRSTVERKTPEQLAEAVQIACLLDGVSHMVLTSGTGDPPGSEIQYLAACVQAIKAVADIPIQVQFAPPECLDLIDLVWKSGADAVGIHVESVDMEVLSRIAPAKAEMGWERYCRAWRHGVERFGPGRVSSFLIAGLGETPETLIRGCEYLADMGVYPFVVPFRPLPGSTLEHRLPPDPEIMKRVYEAVSRILSRKGMSSARTLAGCPRCGACSAISAYEKKIPDIICHSARTEAENLAAYRIRESVFVREQNVFSESDRDEHDLHAVQIVAKAGDQILGTVRIYPVLSEPGHWVGGRLAVRKEYRTGRTGSLLVKEAMKRVKQNGCQVFTADIQEQNVRFFQKLGWTAVGHLRQQYGISHQPMQADLSRVPEDWI